MPGDLLFYNESENIDEVLTHVMLYTGNFNYNEENYNVIHAMLDTKKISPALYDVNEEKLTTLGSNKVLNIVAYGRLKKPDTNGVYWYIMNSPASMIVTDPDDEIVDKNNPESVSMEYFYYNVDNDEEIEDVVMVTTRKQGEYKIQVVPNNNASPTDTFTLEIKTSTSTIMLAENIPIEDIPDQPYVIRVTETEIIPVIPATIDCDPDTLNLKSNGKWIPCYIELSAGYDVWQIDGSTIILNEVISAYLGKEGWAKSESNKSNIMDHDGDGILERMVKFDRSNIQAILSPEERIPIILAGKVFHNGIYIEFKGSDVIRVIK